MSQSIQKAPKKCGQEDQQWQALTLDGIFIGFVGIRPYSDSLILDSASMALIEIELQPIERKGSFDSLYLSMHVDVSDSSWMHVGDVEALSEPIRLGIQGNFKQAFKVWPTALYRKGFFVVKAAVGKKVGPEYKYKSFTPIRTINLFSRPEAKIAGQSPEDWVDFSHTILEILQIILGLLGISSIPLLYKWIREKSSERNTSNAQADHIL